MNLHGGEYGHKEYHPIGNFVSDLLNVMIIKSFIESILRHDMIAGEKLTGFDRGTQLVDAIVGAVTFGHGAVVLDFSKVTGKEAVKELLKMYVEDAVTDMPADSVINVCDELGMPAGLSVVESLITGCTVSVKAEKYQNCLKKVLGI